MSKLPWKNPFRDERTEVQKAIDTRRYVDRIGMSGAIESFMKRRAAARFKAELDAVEGAISAGARVNNAKAEFARSLERISPNSLDQIAASERAKITAEMHEQQDRLGKAIRSRVTFEQRAQIEDENLSAELWEAKERNKRAREAYQGKIEEPPKTKQERRSEIEEEFDALAEKKRVLDEAFEAAVADGSITEAQEAQYNIAHNRILGQMERLAVEEEGL